MVYKLLLIGLIYCSFGSINAQELVLTKSDSAKTKISIATFDGIVIMGYVDYGGFLNFTGPNLNVVFGKHKILIGMLPSLRLKVEDTQPRNAFITPSLGAGITYSYRFLAIQVPFYYNAKTATNNGQWQVGVGLGVRINEFIKRKKI